MAQPKISRSRRAWNTVLSVHPTAPQGFFELWFFECASSTAFKGYAAEIGQMLGFKRFAVVMPGSTRPKYIWAEGRIGASLVLSDCLSEA